MHTLLLLIFANEGSLFGFSNLNHLTRTLLFLALSKVFLSCWNEQKYPHTRVEGVFITWVEKRAVMCLYGVTGRSGHVDRTLRPVHPELQCLQCDRTLASVRLALTGHVRSRFSLSGTLLESTGCWHLVSSHSPLSVWSRLDDFTLIK